jgi:RND family efflux transporter MFP subunit
MNRVKTFSTRLQGLLLVSLALGCDSIESSPSRMNRERAEAQAAPVRVIPIHPARKTLTRWIELPGQIDAFEQTPVYAKVTGYVDKVEVDVGAAVAGPERDADGTLVREGQVLVELSVPELKEELQQKKALIAQALAEVRQAGAAIKLAKSAAVSARTKVDEAEAAAEQVQAEFDFAQSEFTRMKDLAKRGTATSEVAEEKGKQLRAADAKRRQAQARVETARAGFAESQPLIEKAEADQKTAEARLGVANADAARVESLFAFTRIRAPGDGVVTARNVLTGQVTKPGVDGGEPLLMLGQTHILRLVVDVPKADAPLVAVGAEARVNFSGSDSETLSVAIKRTAWSPGSASSALRAEIDLPNDQGRLRPGMLASVKLKLAERTGALSLPSSAVLSADDKPYCFTIGAESRVVETPLETGIRAGDDIEIVSGLTGDEQVIGANAAAFHAGQAVEVVEP